MKKILSRIVNTVNVTDVEIVLLTLLLFNFRIGERAKIHGVELESLEYQGAKLYWEEGNPMPEERLEIFYEVMDSLSEDVTEEYSLNKNPTDFFYLTADEYYQGELTGGVNVEVGAFQRGAEVFLSPVLVDSNNNDVLFYSEQFRDGSRETSDNNQVYDDGYFAMVLIHEYVHVVQFNNPGYLNNYANDVGWQGNYKPKEDENFYSVLSPYSLENPHEDMSETYMYSYLCGNNLEALSEVRLQYIDDFWAIPREEYCKNFN